MFENLSHECLNMYKFDIHTLTAWLGHEEGRTKIQTYLMKIFYPINKNYTNLTKSCKTEHNRTV